MGSGEALCGACQARSVVQQASCEGAPAALGCSEVSWLLEGGGGRAEEVAGVFIGGWCLHGRAACEGSTRCTPPDRVPVHTGYAERATVEAGVKLRPGTREGVLGWVAERGDST